jgi:hypothetical protein
VIKTCYNNGQKERLCLIIDKLPKHLITKIDLCSNNVSLTKGITVLDAVLWIDISWKETKDSTIISCFRIAGFPVVLIE